MEHFGMCEREEGDGNNSAFTLVLPKENQGESCAESEWPSRDPFSPNLNFNVPLEFHLLAGSSCFRHSKRRPCNNSNPKQIKRLELQVLEWMIQSHSCSYWHIALAWLVVIFTKSIGFVLTSFLILYWRYFHFSCWYLCVRTKERQWLSISTVLPKTSISSWWLVTNFHS